MSKNGRLKSRVMLDGIDRAPARAMLKAVGFTDRDLRRPLIGIANTWIEVMPCNYHLRRLSERVKAGVRAGVEATTRDAGKGLWRRCRRRLCSHAFRRGSPDRTKAMSWVPSIRAGTALLDSLAARIRCPTEQDRHTVCQSGIFYVDRRSCRITAR